MIQIPGDKALYIAMAGPHQIWKLDLAAGVVCVFAGSGHEDIMDGPAASANFAQPSGLATDGENLFVADSEVSGVRVITGVHDEQGRSFAPIVGEGLFEFGDNDGRPARSAFSIAWGLPMRAATSISPILTTTRSRSASRGTAPSDALSAPTRPATSDDPPHFYEPGGLSAPATGSMSPIPTITRSKSST